MSEGKTAWRQRLKEADGWRWGKALLMALLPLLSCVLACALEGHTIADVYLPASQWNDELFYFKQVEGMVNFGYPQGYFGFNESHALKASFAAWSPVLVFPWILWGLLFGWHLLSPVICNILFMSFAVFVFVYLVKPAWKQLLLLSILFVSFTPFTRFMLSGMPEAICFSMVIMTLAVGISYQEQERNGKLALLFAMTSVMTLMRPYLIVFMLLPIYFWIKKKKWWGVAGSAAVILVTGGIYIGINHFLGAEYFTPLFDVTWLTTFLDKGLFGGLKYMVWLLFEKGRQFVGMLIEGFRSGLAPGALMGGFTLMMGILFWQSCVDYVKKRKKQLELHAYLFLCFLGMFAALLLMYKLKEGGRHLATFIGVGLFAVSVMETRFFRKAIAAAAVFAYLFSVMATDLYEYQIPFATEELVQEVGDWQDIFNRELSLKEEDTPNFDNVIIWPFSDEVEGKAVITAWQMLYGLPEGFGVSCCYSDYVLANMEQLQSRYISAPQGGAIDTMCREQGYREIGRSGELVVYERY